jgi:hypothetical protein
MHNLHVSYRRAHKTLSNGQEACIHIKQERHRFLTSPRDNYNVYCIGFVIANKRRTANDWYKKKVVSSRVRHKQTGRVGVEGLRFAFNEIKRLKDIIKYGEYIVIDWDDNKRKCSYKYLERIGFRQGDWDGFPCYYYQKEKCND